MTFTFKYTLYTVRRPRGDGRTSGRRGGTCSRAPSRDYGTTELGETEITELSEAQPYTRDSVTRRDFRPRDTIAI